MSRFRRCLSRSVLWLGLLATPCLQAQALQTIHGLDVPRYMGVWYEIAKFPNWFQRKCVGDTSAQYSVLAPGRLRVLNRCRLADGQFDQAVGEALQTGGDTSPRLQVRFAPAWLSWLPLIWGDYWVIDLEDDYQMVAVSEPRREYLWVLARSPEVDPQRYARLMERLRAQGLDTDRLEKTSHQAAGR